MNDDASIWMIGDLQGCCHPLEQLLEHPDITDDPNATFWFAGDLINRGPTSLQTLRRVMALGERAVVVLGNHDLHLLAVAAGVRDPGKSDTLDTILEAPDADALIHWLRHCPLAHYQHNHLLVHAGVLPHWDAAKTLELAAEVEAALRGPNWKKAIGNLFGNKPARWNESHQGYKRLRAIVNALTRIRMCKPNGKMEFAHKGAPSTDEGLIPWFDLPGRATGGDTVVFGHWSTLGLMVRPDAICLDTGCVWGRELTALRLQDRKLVQIQCQRFQQPSLHEH